MKKEEKIEVECQWSVAAQIWFFVMWCCCVLMAWKSSQITYKCQTFFFKSQIRITISLIIGNIHSSKVKKSPYNLWFKIRGPTPENDLQWFPGPQYSMDKTSCVLISTSKSKWNGIFLPIKFSIFMLQGKWGHKWLIIKKAP